MKFTEFYKISVCNLIIYFKSFTLVLTSTLWQSSFVKNDIEKRELAKNAYIIIKRYLCLLCNKV